MNSPAPSAPGVRRIGLACFIAAGLVPLCILVAWRLGYPGTRLFDLVASLVVMLLGVSIAACLCQLQTTSRLPGWIGQAFALGTLAFCVGIIYQGSFQTPRWEEWLSARLLPA